jgi:hypothetical protein
MAEGDRYGIWYGLHGERGGWAGLASGNTLVPMAHDQEEAAEILARVKKNLGSRYYVEARRNPPAELAWNEEEFKRRSEPVGIGE